MRPYGLIASVLGMLIAADVGDDAAKEDLEKFQGHWNLISAERDGKKTPQEDAKKLTLSIQGNKFILQKDAVIISEGTMTLHATKKPKEIDETITTGPNKGKVFWPFTRLMTSITRFALPLLARIGHRRFPRRQAVVSYSRSGSGRRNDEESEGTVRAMTRRPRAWMRRAVPILVSALGAVVLACWLKDNIDSPTPPAAPATPEDRISKLKQQIADQEVESAQAVARYVPTSKTRIDDRFAGG
jgi:uncharacterized protein (TIGR03067 family)